MSTRMRLQILKSGEYMDIYRVPSPCEDFAVSIKEFLAHKPAQYQEHLNKFFAGTVMSVTYMYVGEIGVGLVGTAMLAERGKVGLVAHVYTAPQQRQKGVSRALMELLMDDFKLRGGHTLWLGTAPDSPAYLLYKSLGFADIYKPGFMVHGEPHLLETTIFDEALFLQ